MDVLIFGGRGLIGQALAEQVIQSGNRAWVFSRRETVVSHGTVVPYALDTIKEDILALPLEKSYVIVNLAGESISGGRWTKQRKQAILESRVRLTGALASAIHELPDKPVSFISGSAVGYYGSSSTRTFTESSPSGVGFLSDVTRAWEHAALVAQPDTRVVILRTGVVLANRGGALPQMVLPYRLFVGGRVGSGQQWVSWIHVADAVGIIDHCMRHPEVQGIVNVTAPNPVVMSDFGRTIANVLDRPHWFPVPATMMRLLFGEMSEIVLEGQRVLPNVAIESGYQFQFQSVLEALSDVLKGNGTDLA